MAVGKPGKKSIGGNTSMGNGPKTPDNKRKSLQKPTPAPTSAAKKPAPVTPMAKKDASPDKKPQGISHQLSKVSEQSKGIKKGHQGKGKNQGPNKQQHNKAQKGGAPGSPQKQQGNKKPPGHHGSKKNRRQRLQAKLSSKERSPMSQSRALKAEQELNKTSSRILLVRLPDTPFTAELVKTWSPNIENALFPKPVDPRTFLIVMKPDTNVKKEIETLKKVTFGGGKLVVEERKPESNYEGKAGENVSPSDLIDPYTLYVTNLDESVTRDELKDLFPKATTIMNPKKHNPRVAATGSGTKFCFVGFDTAEDALAAFKTSFNKEFKGGKFLVMRFRRVARNEIKKEAAAAATPAKRKAEDKQEKTADNKKSKVVKEEPKEEVADDDEDEDDDEDDDEDAAEIDDDDDSEDDEDDDDEDDDDDDDDE